MMKYLIAALIVLAGCDKPKSADVKNAQLVKVTVREVLMYSPTNSGPMLKYIVQDGTSSKTANIDRDITYVPVIGDEVMVSGWGDGVWGDAVIVSVVTKTKAEVEYP
jgi:hypothetical protein